MSQDFWDYLQQLVESCEIEVDQPKGSTHPRYPGRIYPVDYGYLRGSTSLDGGGVDIWIGSMGMKTIVGALCTVDLFKKDTELKILYDCSDAEITAILNFVNGGQMRAIFVRKDN